MNCIKRWLTSLHQNYYLSRYSEGQQGVLFAGCFVVSKYPLFLGVNLLNQGSDVIKLGAGQEPSCFAVTSIYCPMSPSQVLQQSLAVLLPAALLVTTAFQLLPAPGSPEIRELPAFTAISLSARVTVKVRQGSPQHVVVEALADDLRKLKTGVTRNRLYIYTEQIGTQVGPLTFNPHTATLVGPVTVYVTLPTVRGLAVNGSGQLQADTIQAQRLSLGVSGSGQLRINQLRSDTLRAVLSSSGSIMAAGICTYSYLGVSGSGRIQALALAVQDCRARLQSSGNCQVNVARSLDAYLSGSGSVLVSGHPQITSRTSGSGRVRLTQ